MRDQLVRLGSIALVGLSVAIAGVKLSNLLGSSSPTPVPVPGWTDPPPAPPRTAPPAPPTPTVPPDPDPAEWRHRCEELDDHLLALNRAKESGERLSEDFAPVFVARCKEKYTVELLDCILAAQAEDDAFACGLTL